MKKINFLIIAFVLIASSGCKKYLDVNNNPNGPSTADPALYLPSIQSQYAQGIQLDSRYSGPIVQNYLLNSTGLTASSWEQHGYASALDNSADFWRSVYWRGGQNTQDVKNISRDQKKWDLYGTALALEAWGWQMLTDYHGEIIVKEAYDPARNTFDYDTQDTVYAVVKRECMDAIEQLKKSTDAVGSPLFAKFDMIYKGDRNKWKKFVYGTLALNAHHLIKKSAYNPDEVISYVDSAFSTNADDALVPFLGSNSTDANFFGPLRGNMASYLQSGFIVRLTDGTVFGGAVDPRRLTMLTPSDDGVYRGQTPFTNYSSTVAATAQGIKNIWGVLSGTIPPIGTGKFLFQDKAPFPLMTYSELQFIKAEAAMKKGDMTLALAAYKNGINASLDFVRNGAIAPGASPTGAAFPFGTATAAYDAAKTAFLANPAVIPITPAGLTQQMILLQKYIALWGYGFIETWVDLRRFDYDPTVFTSFALPTPLFTANGGKPAYRMRPRYNSEYVWNIDALTKIKGFDADYMTRKMWIQLP